MELFSVAMDKVQKNFKSVDCGVSGLLNQFQEAPPSRVIMIKILTIFIYDILFQGGFFVVTYSHKNPKWSIKKYLWNTGEGNFKHTLQCFCGNSI